MNKTIVIMILLMTAVTYIPRLIPAIVMDKLTFGDKVQKFLGLIPYTAMASLIFPGAISDERLWYVGVAGVVTAMALSWKRVPVMVSVVAAVAVDAALYYLLGAII